MSSFSLAHVKLYIVTPQHGLEGTIEKFGSLVRLYHVTLSLGQYVSFKRIADLATGFGFQWHGRSALRKDIYAVQQVPIAVVVCRQVRHIGPTSCRRRCDASDLRRPATGPTTK